MLELYKILWVIPGVIFIHIYNKRRPAGSINLSGWSYIFSLVVIAVFVWVPTEVVIKKLNVGDWEGFWIVLAASAVSAFLAILFIYFKWLSKLIFLPVYDIFFISCVKWEKKSVILSLKNDKIYVGILLKYPENPKSKYETQMISILPIISGGRDRNTKRVKWGRYYPKKELGYPKKGISYPEITIPRSEIVTFGEFSEEIFQYFQSYESHDSHNRSGDSPWK